VNTEGSAVNIQVGDQTASIDLHSQPLVKETFLKGGFSNRKLDDPISE